MARGRMGGGNMNYSSMLKQAQKMQADIAKAQEELENSTFESKAEAGSYSCYER